MAKLISFTIKRRGRETLIATLRDAQAMSATLFKRQFEGDLELIGIAEMIDHGIAGYQKPTVGFDAFAKFASAKGLVSVAEKSPALMEFSAMVGRIRRL